MQKIILFYKFVPLADPLMTQRWLREVCRRLNLQGRIILNAHGINGTLGGGLEDVKGYVREMNRTAEFKKIEYKWSDGDREDFPRLSIKVRKELVTLAPEEAFNVFDKGTPLRPEAWRTYIEEHPDALIFDARNEYESDIGAFTGAVKPKIKNFREIKKELEYLPKDQPVLTYCTGDIRCEYLSAYMKHKGFGEVYHLDGGIMKYGQTFGNDGNWEGKCYVFDKRMKIAFKGNSKDIGKCSRCGANTSNHENCANQQCNKLILLCRQCAETKVTCSSDCSADLPPV